MAETRPGGAYQGPDGRWHDAEGRPLNKEAVSEARKTLDEQQEQKAEAERLRLELEANANPFGQAVASLLGRERRQAAPAAKPAKADEKGA